MTNEIILQSIALDLKRIAISFHSNSEKSGERFLKEVKNRLNLLDSSYLPQVVKKQIDLIKSIEKEKNQDLKAEIALRLSIIILSFSKQKN